MITVSVVEDNVSYRSALCAAFDDHDEFILQGQYASGEQAKSHLPDNPPDVAIVDIQMGDVSGIDLISEIKYKMPSTQFLMCTAFQDNTNVLEALKAGALGYIVKGSSLRQIQEAVLELYNGGSPMSPFIARKVINLLSPVPKQSRHGLSTREEEVLMLLSKGLLYKEISDNLSISANTVKNHLKNIYKKLHVQNKVEAVNCYAQFGT